ncbi:hypothetical protein AU468_09645 [Alkalispirochaeta sphaeroplastigenens]|uniref:EamA domain-containing protein n=1 Tax=Alkalispirochaeta sphaeroplastigenens TaxID=1187066 RepID=A0A2S4JLR0_9SPIO|nr:MULTISPECIES: EamA family transporter [Alkalispirochaeta]POR00486.1 hypothetical protein AU468_09645 [Alkalispirochaeta sphaeroplastigenens]
MSVTAILLVLVSALVHAGWNLLGKRDSANGAYFCMASATGAILLLPLLWVWRSAVGQIPPVVWWYLLPTGIFQGLYFGGLAGAYRRGDLSVAYPVARAFPVLMVPLFSLILASLLLGNGAPPGKLALTGMIVVTLGLLVLPQERLDRFSPGHLWGRWIFYAFLAGLGTTGYSLVDDRALSAFRAALSGDMARLQAPLLYAALQSASTAAVLAFLGVLRQGPRRFGRSLRALWGGSAFLAGAAIVVAYGLVLVAYGFAQNVSYVVAFRQVSLPLGTLMGVVLLQERLTPPRLVGTVLIIAGLVLVSLG